MIWLEIEASHERTDQSASCSSLHGASCPVRTIECKTEGINTTRIGTSQSFLPGAGMTSGFHNAVLSQNFVLDKNSTQRFSDTPKHCMFSFPRLATGGKGKSRQGCGMVSLQPTTQEGSKQQ